MRTYCPDAVPVGTASIKDWGLVFRYHLTIEPGAANEVPVGVWEISDEDEAELDRFESAPSYYSKKLFIVKFQYLLKVVQPILIICVKDFIILMIV